MMLRYCKSRVDALPLGGTAVALPAAQSVDSAAQRSDGAVTKHGRLDLIVAVLIDFNSIALAEHGTCL
jgi:hypothetical protein